MTLRVIAFTPQPASGAAGRYRVHQWRAPLAAHGIELTPAPFFDDRAFGRLHARGRWLEKGWDLARLTRERIAWLRVAGRYDLALVHRELWPLAGEWPLALLRRGQPRWVFDLDDAVFLPNVSPANRGLGPLKAHGSAAPLAHGARAVAAGNSWLAAWARRERNGGAAEDVEVIPTVVDSDHWRPEPAGPGGGPVRLVWLGSATTLPYLAAWLPALRRVAARHPDVELHVIGARLDAPGLRVVVHAWSAATERDLAARCHVGLAPLGPGEWERGKCGLKLLLYMALGLAAVAADAGVHPEIVTAGADGMLVRDEDALVAALDRLLDDAGERARLGSAARATLERRFSLRALAPRFAALLHRAAEAA